MVLNRVCPTSCALVTRMPFRMLIALRCLSGLVMLAPDDGGGNGPTAGGPPAPAGSEGGGGGQAPHGAPAATTPAAPALSAEQQAAVNAEVARQLGAAVAPKVDAATTKARTQWEADLKALADAENQTAEQKAQAAADAAKAEAATAIAQANATLVSASAQVAAVAAGAKADRIPALLKLADLSEVTVTDGTPDADAVKTAITKALTDYPEFKTGATPPPAGTSGGDMGGSTNQAKPKTLADAVAKHYAA